MKRGRQVEEVVVVSSRETGAGKRCARAAMARTAHSEIVAAERTRRRRVGGENLVYCGIRESMRAESESWPTVVPGARARAL